MDESANTSTLPAARRNRKPPTTARARLNPARSSLSRAPLGGRGLMFPKRAGRYRPKPVSPALIPAALLEGKAERLLLRILAGAHLVGIAHDGPEGAARAVLEVRLTRCDLERLVTFGVEREDVEIDDTDTGVDDSPHDAPDMDLELTYSLE